MQASTPALTQGARLSDPQDAREGGMTGRRTIVLADRGRRSDTGSESR